MDATLSLVAAFAKSLGSVYGAISNYLYCIGVAGAAAAPGLGSNVYPPGKHAPTRRALATAAPGQKIGLLEYDTFRPSDVADWLTVNGFNGISPDTVHQVHVNGGVASPGPGEAEVLVDVDTVLGMTAIAEPSVVVYDAPPSTSFAQMFQAMIDDGDTVISNSWSQCEDQTSSAEAHAIDAVLANAAASGITVLNATGDDGPDCLDGAANTIGVPADSPHATAVGGTTPYFGPALTAGEERYWDSRGDTPAGGASGYGVSRYFDRPAYQDGHTTAAGRSIPDLALPADPHAGLQLCRADDGGCPDNRQWGGTSMAAPVAAALVADLNVATGHNVGDLNGTLYPLANTSAFRSAAKLESNFAHVGLGSPDFGAVAQKLNGLTTGPVSAGDSLIGATDQPQADGKQVSIVRVVLHDTRGYPVTGKAVTLTATGGAQVKPASATSGSDGAAAFTITNTTAQVVTLSATGDSVALDAHPTVTFVTPAATGATLIANPTSVVNDGAATTTVSVYLQDSQGRPAVGKTVSLSSTGSGIIAPASHQTTTAANGVATFTVRDFANESVSLKAVDATDGNLPVPGTATVNFDPAGTAACNDTPPTPVAGSGLTLSPFATGVPNNDHPIVGVYGGITFTTGACVGVSTPAYDGSGNVFVPSPVASQIYEFGPGGGVAGAATALPGSTFGPGELVGGLAFGKDGRLYASRYNGGDYTKPEIVEVNPASGGVVRVVATRADGLPYFPNYLAVDPISGDLFSVDDGSGAGTGNDNVTRIAHPESAHPTLTPYANVGGVQTGITFAPDGTMYVGVVTGQYTNAIVAATATNSATPGTVTKAADIPGSPFGVNVSKTNASGHATELIVSEAGGNIDRADLTAQPATVTALATRPYSFSTGSSLGPDGCLYFNDQDQVLRVRGISPRCAAQQDAGPRLTLSADGATTPATGDSVGFTATLSGVSGPQGTPLFFEVSGPNVKRSLVRAGADGTAKFSYTGAVPGIDRVRAVTTVGDQTISSAPIAVTWSAGKHVSFMSARASGAGTSVNLSASLADVSVNPAEAVAGANVTLSLGGQSCTAVTDSAGKAACAVPAPAGAGLATVTATFDGSPTLTAARAGNVFATAAAPTTSPPPAVVQSSPPPTATTPAPLAPSPALACTSASIVLINVYEHGARVVISGAAKLALAGKKVQIFLAQTRKAVATAMIAKDGTFATTAPLPAKKIRNTSKARYIATVASAHSAALKLTRRMVVTQATAKAGRVRLAGTVAKPLLKGAKVTIRRRTSCHGYETVATVKVNASGTWSASLPAGAAAVYRAQLKVKAGHKTQTTYSLPIAV